MSLEEFAAEVGRGLLTQLPSALLVALTTTGLAAIKRRRRSGRAAEGAQEVEGADVERDGG
ncbi:hypothetical protein ACFYVL_01870 [Streptomyces sp. NPDC004111]|uniref:hypothetical protein n=1 Tax=Streptomyces sp. NPDC004111 TaxID=3364690 RepID=UPI0036743E11